ncbi:MFS transporter [Sedimenticola sp.]|uniref:MFS transporter n=1 Tax=Sedimenticola sp. TaxID=1940285 RepID=UPI003D09B624
MRDQTRLQLVVFALVAASFTNVYLTQPVLPVLQQEFAASTLQVSFTVAAVILGIALSNLPFGVLADRLPIQPIILAGGVAVALGGLICAFTHNLWILIAARFLQGLFIPALTTCIAAYLAKTLPAERLNVVMGAYVSATVVGGLGGRLLGGWIHPPLHWRYAFGSAALLILITTFVALKQLPKPPPSDGVIRDQPRFLSLLRRWELVRIYLAAAGGFFIFSSVFNYLPFRLAAPPFTFSTELITLLYLVYVMGIFMGPVSGRISNRIGSGNTLIGGTLLLGTSVLLTLLPSIGAIILGLLGLCAGFFAVHAAAVGSLNRRLTGGQGRANALYVLFYYIGGWIGITSSGFAYTQWGWQGVILICLLLLIPPFMAGLGERRDAHR